MALAVYNSGNPPEPLLPLAGLLLRCGSVLFSTNLCATVPSTSPTQVTLERFVRLRRPVFVRMQSQRQLPVGLLDLVVVRPLVHPEHAVVPLRLGAEDLGSNGTTTDTSGASTKGQTQRSLHETGCLTPPLSACHAGRCLLLVGPGGFSTAASSVCAPGVFERKELGWYTRKTAVSLTLGRFRSTSYYPLSCRKWREGKTRTLHGRVLSGEYAYTHTMLVPVPLPPRLFPDRSGVVTIMTCNFL